MVDFRAMVLGTKTARRQAGWHHGPMNPLMRPFPGPQGLPDFASIRPEHIEPAVTAAMAEHKRELDAIAEHAATPSFANTVAAFDGSGAWLGRVTRVFSALTASHTNEALQAVQRRLAAPLAAHRSAVYQHSGVFTRIDALMKQRDRLGLDTQDQRLLERIHLDFVRAGAQLQGEKRERYAKVMQRLAELSIGFAQNVLYEESHFSLPLPDEAAMAGLPQSLRDACAQAAAERGLPPGSHVLTLSRSLVVPFLTFSTRRDLREKLWRAWVGRGETAGPQDNRPLVVEMLQLRQEQASLLGYASFADYALQDRMARTPDAAQALLDNVWARALKAVAQERAALVGAQRAAGVQEELQAWDWRYWAEKVRLARYALDEAELKPYFTLEAMVAAAFDCAQRLFGLRFEARPDWPVYHPDVLAYEVFNAAGQAIGVFLHDNFSRPSKRSGAWMSSLRVQSSVLNGQDALPIVLNNNNFAKGAPGTPTLLSQDDVRTLFHEFGHGLHGLLSQVRWAGLSGTEVLQDFVELPSQIFEHWGEAPEVLRRHARHWQTGAPLPEALIERMRAAQRFNQGYETTRYTVSALVDLALHRQTEPPADPVAWENALLQRLGLPPEVGLNHRLVHFQHLFAGDSYAAGYYVYLWAEVLDADAFGAFEEAGDIFAPAPAQALHQHVYASGNSIAPEQAFRNFRGRDPEVEPLLHQRGLLLAETQSA
jgi:peptidyl-dipeptidase Dcp